MKRIKRQKPSIKLTVTVGLGRDYVHMREITHGSGCGFHQNKKAKLRKEASRLQRRGWECHS